MLLCDTAARGKPLMRGVLDLEISSVICLDHFEAEITWPVSSYVTLRRNCY